MKCLPIQAKFVENTVIHLEEPQDFSAGRNLVVSVTDRQLERGHIEASESIPDNQKKHRNNDRFDCHAIYLYSR